MAFYTVLFVRSIKRCYPTLSAFVSSRNRFQYTAIATSFTAFTITTAAMSSQPLTDKSKPLSGRIAIVTGASRGIGKGIAVQLGEAGAKVYITGREPSKSYAAQQEGLPSLNDTAEEIKNRGGEAVLVYCDHSNPDDVKKLFDKVASECDQKLDILVNCAFSGAPSILEGAGKKFYDFDPLVWDEVNNVGLRNVYICCVYAARLMVPQKRGLIVNISSTGGLHYFFNVVYGVGKAGMDRMATDMAVELKSDGICSVSLWPGAVKTELFKKMVDSGKLSELSGMEIKQDLAERFYKNAETPEFVGRGVVALACDENVMKKSGRILLTSDLGQEYGFVDIDGNTPSHIRSISGALDLAGWSRLAKFVPKFLRFPYWALHMTSNKF